MALRDIWPKQGNKPNYDAYMEFSDTVEQAIDDNVIGATIDEDGHLLLEQRDGSFTDAGQLPPGPIGPAGGVNKVADLQGDITAVGLVDAIEGPLSEKTETIIADAAGVTIATSAQGSRADTAVQPGDLAPVANSGQYSDLNGRPTLGTAAAQDVGAFSAPGHTHAASDIASGTMPVARGGTNRTSHTAYALIAGGTSTTAAQQSIANGASGHFLKSNGTGVLPGFAALTAASVSDSTATGRAVLTAADAAAARLAIGAAAVGAPTTFPTLLGTKVGFVGDSYMAGLGLTTPATQRWPKLFCDAAGVTENNVAVSGAGYIADPGNPGRLSEQAATLAADCTHVLICAGINDAPLYGTEAALTTAVQGTITAVRTRIPNVPITVISPMWFDTTPSSDLLTVERIVRAALPADVTFIEGAPWLRYERPELQQGDGHPNLAGSQLIAAFVRDAMFGKIQPGARYGAFIRTLGDASFSTADTTVASGTIRNAAPGWWELDGTAVMYGVTNGWAFVKAGSAKWRVRSDVLSSNPFPHRHTVRFFHPGGDLAISVGYDPTGTTSVVGPSTGPVTSSTRVAARLID